MKTSYQLSALILAMTSLPGIYARGGPGGGGGGGRGGPPGGGGPPATTPAAAPATTPPAVATPPANDPTSVPAANTAQGTSVAAPPASGTVVGTSAVASQSSSPNSCGDNVQKISLQNNSGKTLIIGAGAPWTVGSCGSIASGSTCTFCQTRGSTGGNLQVGFGVANALGTWIEGEWVTGSLPTVDVSFIPGYSVPITCTSDSSGATVGWSSPLCSDAGCTNCASGGGTWDGNSCRNPSGPSNPNANSLLNGPCPAFFAPSQAGAYCYPNDNGVVGYGDAWSSASCTAGPQSGGSNSKREEGESFFPRAVQEENLTLGAREESDMARRHAAAAAFGTHGGARAHARSLKHLVS